MAHQSALIAQDIEKYLALHEQKSLLRFMTCGSVDDGKSTLIGRLLYESKLIFADQLAALEADSRKANPQGAAGELSLELLLDGLAAEREQGITIDVAYRFFSTERRKFIVADTPGHEQYTRNMVTAASTTDLAIILVDARKGVLTQTRRHSYLVALLGIRQVVLAVNKMDALQFDQNVFAAIVAEYRRFAEQVGISEVTAIPLSALRGDNVTTKSPNTPWYDGPALMPFLESVELHEEHRGRPFRMPVQWVNRPNQDFRGFAGLIASGVVRRGDRLRVLPSGRDSTVSRIVTQGGDLDAATTGQAITLTLTDEIDISRGDILSAAEEPVAVADQFQATVIWMHEEGMLPGRPYLLKLGTQTALATITALRHKVNVNTLEELAAKRLELNEIGVCNLALDRLVAFEPYRDNRELGGFILIDRITNDTIGAGLIHYALRRADNIHWQALDVNRPARAALKGQRPCVLWFTGLSGAGKSTIANLVEKRLHALGRHTYLLDGDNVRHGLNKDLGFTDADRVENIRRVGEVAKLMVDAGLLVLVSFISPFCAERRLARDLVGEGEFFEVYIDTALQEAERRDPKGLYRRARAGKLKNFTGIDSPYEAPEHPDIHIDTATMSAELAAEVIVQTLQDAGMLRAPGAA
jgi:bifunctional enzyme CysN/CysC